MRLHRFYIENNIQDSGIKTQDENIIHQWRNVFRYRAGDSVILFNGNGNDYICEIISLGKKEAELKIIEKKKGIIPDNKVWLFFSFIKKDNAEMILQKCTELGVSNFVPLISDRSEKKGLNIERARKIIIEASEQCGRSDIPVLHEVLSLEKALSFCKENKIETIAFDSEGEQIQDLRFKIHEAGIFVGPEGGWNEREIKIFKEQNSRIFSLGKTTLRAETAAIVVSALSLV